MESPTSEIDGCRRAHERLFATLDQLPDGVATQPSLLPNWSVAHVLAHLALNAQAMTRRIEAALDGREVEQYQGGAAGRSEQIEAGAQRPAGELVELVRTTAAQLDELFASLATEAWSLKVRTVAGGQHPVAHLPFRRWREVEMHHVDLGVGFDVSEVSPSLVDLALPRLLEGLPERTDRRTLTMWLLGRGDAPTLDSWG